MKKAEIHLLVLWENARKSEQQILADIPRHTEILTTAELPWPEDAQTGFQEFYGTYLLDPIRKTKEAGCGKFLCVIIRDPKPRYAYRRTERGMELLNERIYQMKRRYRNWIGGSHIVHGTNSVEEARHDLWLLTGISYDDWESGAWKDKPLKVTSGRKGWESLREVFQTLNETVPYVVLRGYDNLPDNYVRERDTDIDILVSDYRNAAWILHGRKVYPHLKTRPHYEIIVNGSPVRIDLRSVGDGYYCEAWERNILAKRRLHKNGFYVPNEENFLHSLAYHAVLQKKVRTQNLSKVKELTYASGVPSDIANVLKSLREFMTANGYSFTKPSDGTVYFSKTLSSTTDISAEARDFLRISELHPNDLPYEIPYAFDILPRVSFSGVIDGRVVSIDYIARKADLFDTEFRSMQAFFSANPQTAVRPIVWRMADSGTFFVTELVVGKRLSEIIDENKIDKKKADLLADAFLSIRDALRDAKIIHRDIRPENIIVCPDGCVKLTGFAFAVLRKSYKKEKKFVRKHFFQLLTDLGGRYCLAPGKWSDSYSLMTILSTLPRTQKTELVIAKLNNSCTDILQVKAPASQKLKALWIWIRISVQMILSIKARRHAKKQRLRNFCATVLRI